MPLFLYELVPASAEDLDVETVLGAVSAAAEDAGGSVIESQVTGARDRIFVVVEADDASALQRVSAPSLPGIAELTGPDPVRLVGAELADVKAARPEAGYLVEWDFPADLDMETYLARKKANAPKYAEVPEVAFLRTYVREDMAKCVCLYDAPDESVVRRARDVVSTPVDRLHTLESAKVRDEHT